MYICQFVTLCAFIIMVSFQVSQTHHEIAYAIADITIRDSVRWSIGADEGYCVDGTVRLDDGTLSCPRTAHLPHTALHHGLPLLPTSSRSQNLVNVWAQYSRALWNDICGQFWNETCGGQFWKEIYGSMEMKSVDCFGTKSAENSEKKSMVDSSEMKPANRSEMKAVVCSGMTSYLRARPCSYLPWCSSGCGVRARPALHNE